MNKHFFIACFGIVLAVACSKDKNSDTPQTPVVQEITLSETSDIQLKTDETKTIKVSGGNGKTFEATSSNPAVAEVSVKENVVTISAKKEGETTMTISSKGKSKSLKIKVLTTNTEKEKKEEKEKEKENNNEKVLISKITFDPNQERIPLGRPFPLKFTIEPNNASNKSLKWESSNPEFIKIGNDGTAFAVAKFAGKEVTITATAQDGSNTKAEIKVTGVQPISSITIIPSEKKELAVGAGLNLSVEVKPDNASASVSWKSSNSEVASVDAQGNVTAKKEGNATITATANDSSGISQSVEIQVISNVHRIEFANGKTLKVSPKSHTDLTLILYDSENKEITRITSNNAKKNQLKWLSNDSGTASVNEKMQLQTHKAGKTTITVTYDDGRNEKLETTLEVIVE